MNEICSKGGAPSSRAARLTPSPNVGFVDDDVALMDTDAELDAIVGWHIRIALRHAALNFDRAAHRIDDTLEFHKRAISTSPVSRP